MCIDHGMLFSNFRIEMNDDWIVMGQLRGRTDLFQMIFQNGSFRFGKRWNLFSYATWRRQLIRIQINQPNIIGQSATSTLMQLIIINKCWANDGHWPI